MTNFNHFEKPMVHFGNVGEQKPEPPAAATPSMVHFGSEAS